MAGSSGISVCVVEDEADLRDETVAALVHYGFATRGFAGSRELYLGLLQEPCDVVVLDIGLPGEDGLSIMAHLRSCASVGIVMLTARGQVGDRVLALRGGADAYLVKPVDMEELAATLLSVARRVCDRRREVPAGEAVPQDWRLTVDGWFLLSPAGHRIPLSATEKALVEALAEQPGTVVSRDMLIQALGYHADEVVSNRLDMAVSRLRRKVSEHSGLSLPLRSVRGIGFTLLPDGRAEH